MTNNTERLAEIAASRFVALRGYDSKNRWSEVGVFGGDKRVEGELLSALWEAHYRDDDNEVVPLRIEVRFYTQHAKVFYRVVISEGDPVQHAAHLTVQEGADGRLSAYFECGWDLEDYGAEELEGMALEVTRCPAEIPDGGVRPSPRSCWDESLNLIIHERDRRSSAQGQSGIA